MVFENQSFSTTSRDRPTAGQHFGISQIEGKNGAKKSFDKPVIRLSNGTVPFICNKACMGGGVF